VFPFVGNNEELPCKCELCSSQKVRILTPGDFLSDFRSPHLGGYFLDSLLTIIATPPMEKKTIQLQKEKDTKNTVKFAEVQTQGQAPIIGTLYLQKWFAAIATNLKVTVEAQRAIPGAGRSVQFSDAL